MTHVTLLHKTDKFDTIVSHLKIHLRKYIHGFKLFILFMKYFFLNITLHTLTECQLKKKSVVSCINTTDIYMYI